MSESQGLSESDNSESLINMVSFTWSLNCDFLVKVTNSKSVVTSHDGRASVLLNT